MLSEAAEQNRRIVERFVTEGIIEGRLDVLDELCDPSVINHAAAPQAREGIEGLKRVLGFSRAAMPDQRWTDQVVIATTSTWSYEPFGRAPGQLLPSVGSRPHKGRRSRWRWCTSGGWPTGRSSNTGPFGMILV